MRKKGKGILSLALLGLGWLILAIGLLADARRPSPEGTLRGYLLDLQSQQLEAALAALTPREAARWRDFLEFQQFNQYELISIAVRSPSLLESLSAGTPWRGTQATLVADIVEPSGVRWRGSTIVPMEYVDGRWFLDRPPFAPP